LPPGLGGRQRSILAQANTASRSRLFSVSVLQATSASSTGSTHVAFGLLTGSASGEMR
jgi:hypothetical protein